MPDETGFSNPFFADICRAYWTDHELVEVREAVVFAAANGDVGRIALAMPLLLDINDAEREVIGPQLKSVNKIWHDPRLLVNDANELLADEQAIVKARRLLGITYVRQIAQQFMIYEVDAALPERPQNLPAYSKVLTTEVSRRRNHAELTIYNAQSEATWLANSH